MAYDANTDETESTVAGSTPLSQGSGQAAPQSQEMGSTPNQPSTPANIQTGGSVNQATSQGNAANQSSAKASSGMFTNVQKYVNKNRPQAQKMAQAVTQDFSKQADAIRQEADKQRSQQKSQLEANQTLLDQQRKEAEGIVGGIMGTQPTQQPTQQPEIQPMDVGSVVEQNQGRGSGDVLQRPSVGGPEQVGGQPQVETKPASWEDQVARFQALSQGPVGVQEVGDLNLSKQNIRAQALSKLAQGSDREQFRRNLMQQTFGDRQYTRGQSSLDDLIMGGSQDAREQIISGTKGAAENLQNTLGDIRQMSQDDILAEQQAVGAFGDEVTGFAKTAETEKEAMLQNEYNKFIKDRKSQLESQYGDVYKGLSERQKQNLALLEAGDYGEGYSEQESYARRLAEILKSPEQKTSLWSRGERQLGNLAKGFGGTYLVEDGKNHRGMTQYDTVKASMAERDTEEGRLGRINEDKFEQSIKELLGRVGYGTQADLGARDFDQVRADYWDDSSSSRKASEDQYFKVGSLGNALKNLYSSQKDLDFNKKLKGAIQKQSGASYADILSGKDVNKFDVADDQSLDRFNKLQELLGDTSDIITDDRRKKNYATTDALSSLLNKYRVK